MAMTSDPVGRIRTRKERYSTTCPAYSVRLNGGFKNQRKAPTWRPSVLSAEAVTALQKRCQTDRQVVLYFSNNTQNTFALLCSETGLR